MMFKHQGTVINKRTRASKQLCTTDGYARPCVCMRYQLSVNVYIGLSCSSSTAQTIFRRLCCPTVPSSLAENSLAGTRPEITGLLRRREGGRRADTRESSETVRNNFLYPPAACMPGSEGQGDESTTGTALASLHRTRAAPAAVYRLGAKPCITHYDRDLYCIEERALTHTH